MGTSKDYEAPTKPQWSNLKSAVTREAKKGRPTSDKAQIIMNKYIASNGNPKNISDGNGIIGGEAAVKTAHNIANFSSLISQYGVYETFKILNLGSLQGKDIFEITNKLIDCFGESSSTLDDIDARNALTSFLDEVFTSNLEDENDEQEIADILQKKFSVEEINDHFSMFFAYYLYEQFCRVFYERLVTRTGEEKASSFLNGIKEYLISQVESLKYDKNLLDVDWAGQEGKVITSEMLEHALYVFGGE